MARSLLLLTPFLIALSTCVTAADEPLVQGPVFAAGTGGYHTYRIPSLIVTKKGTLLAFCEGRKKGTSDAGDIDLVLRRSTDGGKSWQPMQVVWDDGPNTCGNPCPVVEQESGVIWLLLTHNLGEDKEAAIVEGKSKGSRTVWISKSSDDGVTWDKPVEITKNLKQPDWTWYATGPGVGIQTKSGRLVIPCDNKVLGSKAWQGHVIYSDDKGATWKLGGVVGPNCNESQIAELPDGTLLLNMRSYEVNKLRLIAKSTDGGLTFSKPVEDKTLIEPVCQASLLRYPGTRPLLLFSNPASTRREKLTVRVSRDGGTSWPAARLLHAGPAAYSCLTVLPDKTIACLYERGAKTPYEEITLARFPFSWLEAGPP
ncbi:MAG: glycoside hydrolase [Planctomycetales bacterium]|nr:glycoside hydrolase [Planctomycetales bacterium]